MAIRLDWDKNRDKTITFKAVKKYLESQATRENLRSIAEKDSVSVVKDLRIRPKNLHQFAFCTKRDHKYQTWVLQQKMREFWEIKALIELQHPSKVRFLLMSFQLLAVCSDTITERGNSKQKFWKNKNWFRHKRTNKRDSKGKDYLRILDLTPEIDKVQLNKHSELKQISVEKAAKI